MDLNAKLKHQFPQIEVHYYDYRRKTPPPYLEAAIKERNLMLPAVFLDGRPIYHGGLPEPDELLKAIDGLVAR